MQQKQKEKKGTVAVCSRADVQSAHKNKNQHKIILVMATDFKMDG